MEQAAIWAQSPNLTSIVCPVCGRHAQEVVEGTTRTGWQCDAGHFEKAILRERIIPTEVGRRE